MWKPRSALIWNTTTAAVAKLLPLASSQAWGLFLFFLSGFFDWQLAAAEGFFMVWTQLRGIQFVMDSMQNQDRLSFSAGWRFGDSQIKLGVFFFCCFFNLRHTRATPGHDSVCIHSWRTQRPTARFKRSQQNECVCAQLSPAIEGMDWLMWWLMSVRLGASGRGQVYSLLRCLCCTWDLSESRGKKWCI